MIAVLVLALLVPGSGTVQASAGATAGDATATVTVPGTTDSQDVGSLRPSIVKRFIPYGARRRHQMAAYSKRHYGVRQWELMRHLAVVEHYTTGTTWQGAWNTFASNTKHLGEYPGTCAHFIVHTDGTIYQLVPLWIRCRHVIGMNQLSIGIEHVGRSDAEVIGNDRQMESSLQLTLWLVAKFGIEVRNVIGHGESLHSPLRYERYPEWRCLTHTDMARKAMRTYRGWLKDRARAADVPIGPEPEWVDIGC